MAYIVHMSVLAHITVRCSISLWCLPSLFFSSQMEEQQNVRLPLAPLSGITLTTRAIRSQHYILSNS